MKLKNICNQPEGCYCRSKNSAYHSLQSKEWSSVAPHFGILMLIFRHMKKHQSQRLWCKHLYALHTARRESRQSAGTDALTLRFAHSQCRFCVGDFHPIPLYRLSPTVFRMPILSPYMIMHHFAHFVNRRAPNSSKNKHSLYALNINCSQVCKKR